MATDSKPDAGRFALQRLLLWLVIHGMLVAAFGGMLLFQVPAFKRTFMDFGMKLPSSTMVLLDLSDIAVKFYFLVPPAFLVFLAIDAIVLHFLGQPGRPRLLQLLWGIVVALLLFAACGFVQFALQQPMQLILDKLQGS